MQPWPHSSSSIQSGEECAISSMPPPSRVPRAPPTPFSPCSREDAAVAASSPSLDSSSSQCPRAPLWGELRPHQIGGGVPDGFPRRTGQPLGCAVLRASDLVHAGSDFPPAAGLDIFRTPSGSRADLRGSFGMAAAATGGFGDARSRFGGFGGHGSALGPAGLPALPESFGAAGGPPLGPNVGSHRPEAFRFFQRALRPLDEDSECLDGWGSGGWGGDCPGVKRTSGDAALSKFSASLLGYFPDEFLKHFVKNPTRMQPLINRGYYSRVEAIRRLIAAFLKDAEELAARRPPRDSFVKTVSPRSFSTGEVSEEDLCRSHERSSKEGGGLAEGRTQGQIAQVVNFGAGADTTAFFLARDGRAIAFDLDFPDVCREKEAVIQRVPELRECLGPSCASREAPDDPCVLRTTNYRLVAADLRNLQNLKSAVAKAGFRQDLPTLFLCECVLIYLRVEEADAVLKWAAEASLAPCALVLYEQFNPEDPFGRVMIRNLQTRDCPLLTIRAYPTLDSQKKRFVAQGWPESSVADMRHVYEKFLPKEERERVQALEIFDELEEWWLIQSHYFLAVLLRPAPSQAGGATLPSLSSVFEQHNLCSAQ
ncbi:leucine carboxyl methyltransferase 1 [Cyclospora cayetanensis]|uniref:[phosphatase 2A protein]-leucine-carboxy methyltransferase n=1 Tax=Cyclospora cayetanensis TaxID=88456 RepID=A0A6P6RWK6_9EIME|nr:leucine carboxyl methyltransferase 1 [Cyclospora cayetanensis]